VCKAPLVSPERSSTSDGDRLRVGFEATPLLGRPTGVGAFCAGALAGLAANGSVELSAFAVSWRRRHRLAALVPSGVSSRHRAMPARPLHASWSRGPWPPVEWFIGHQDVVHGTNFVVPPTGTAARVVTVHDLTVVLYPELCDPPTLLFPQLIRKAVAEGAWVHTPSRFVADQVTEAFAVPPERVRAVHHGIPLAPVGPQPTTPAVGLPGGCNRYILAVGTVEPRKDYPLLVAAFNEVASAHDDVALVVVGQDGWGAERFTAAVDASPFGRRIVRAGYLDDVGLDAVLRNAALLAYPSRYEGFGFPPLQAMAAGVPVVTTTAGALPEVVGTGALLVEPGDRDGLAGALAQVLEGGTDIDGLVHRGLAQSQLFTWEACADGLVGLYRDARDAIRSGRAYGDAPRPSEDPGAGRTGQ
jgi:glycosyltransferase involved in cell wall biosynthesis